MNDTIKEHKLCWTHLPDWPPFEDFRFELVGHGECEMCQKKMKEAER